MYFYLYVQCGHHPSRFTNREYIRIKSNNDGKQILILSNLEIISCCMLQKTQLETQIIVDNWIDIENDDPPLDEDENEILQDYINIEVTKRLLDG